jgi:hypothetical protein
MLRSRLIEAITYKGDAFAAVDRVKKACERTLNSPDEVSLHNFHCIEEKEKKGKKGKHICPLKANHCLLAIAWAKPFYRISVGGMEVNYFQGNEHVSEKSEFHPYSDVVRWFDGRENSRVAAQEVLQLINRG